MGPDGPQGPPGLGGMSIVTVQWVVDLDATVIKNIDLDCPPGYVSMSSGYDLGSQPAFESQDHVSFMLIRNKRHADGGGWSFTIQNTRGYGKVEDVEFYVYCVPQQLPASSTEAE
jgi:hypothetical protein